MRSLRNTTRVVLLTSVMFAAPAFCQMDPPAVSHAVPAEQAEKKAATEAQDHAIKVRVNEVIVPVTILDSKGEMVFDVTQG